LIEPEPELTEAIGAAPHERSAERSALRNGHRALDQTTTAGDLELRILKPRTGLSRRCWSGAGEWIRHCSPW
jgi:transposase-like protein